MRAIAFPLVAILVATSACQSRPVQPDQSQLQAKQAVEEHLRQRIGQQWWTKEWGQTTFKDNRWQDFNVREVRFEISDVTWYKGEPYYRIVITQPTTFYHSGTGYVNAASFSEARFERLSSKERRAEEAQKKQIRKEAAEQASREEMDRQMLKYGPQIKEVLVKARFPIGATVWAKHRLEKTVLKDVRLKEETLSGKSVPVVYLIVDDDRKDQTLLLGRLDDVLAGKVTGFTEDYYTKLPAWGAARIREIRNGEISLGMTEDQVLASWGSPRKVNNSTGRWGNHQQWIYGDFGPYVYLENGRLTSWQN